MVQPVETDDELAKREALVEALTTFYSVVRKTRRSSAPQESELLNSAGKLSMEDIIPIYRVSSLRRTFTLLLPAYQLQAQRFWPTSDIAESREEARLHLLRLKRSGGTMHDAVACCCQCTIHGWAYLIEISSCHVP